MPEPTGSGTQVLDKPSVTGASTAQPLETKSATSSTTSTQAQEATASVKEDLVTRASKVKLEDASVAKIDEPKFDLNDIEKITDPQAKEQALRAYKSFQRGFNEKYQELAEIRKSLESAKQQVTAWTPDRIKQEMNKPDFIQASQAVLQEQNPPNSGMADAEWSSLTASEKKQWQAMQSELTSLKQQQAQTQILHNFKLQDEQLKTKYANYDPNAVDLITSELLAGKRQATREDLFRSLDYENAVKRAYELGKQDGGVEKTEKTNASAYDGLTTGKLATDIPQPEKNEGVTSYFRRLVENNITKQKAQR
jgi:hypothetical protein